MVGILKCQGLLKLQMLLKMVAERRLAFRLPGGLNHKGE